MTTSYYVSLVGSDTNSGAENAPFLTLQHAISQASHNDTIIVKDGTYNLGDSNSNNVINIDKPLTIIGRENDNAVRPIININTSANSTAVLCNASDITLKGIEFNHISSYSWNDTCINLSPGGTAVYPDAGVMVNQNINIIDCKIQFTKFGVSSKAKFFTVDGCEFVSKAGTTARSIAIYSQDGTIDIKNNIFTSSVNNNAVELLHNTFATNDSYQNKRNGTVNFTNNTTQGIIINKRAIIFTVGADSGLEGDSYSFNISNNNITSSSDCLMLLQPNNPEFLNFISLITLNNNTFNNNNATKYEGLVRVASWINANMPLKLNEPNLRFKIYSNTIQKTDVDVDDTYNVDDKNVLTFTGFESDELEGLIGGLSKETINSILTTIDNEQDQVITEQPQIITFLIVLSV